MLVFDLAIEQRFDLQKHVERVLGRVGEGDVTVACWEPGQVSPNHLHPNATEIYFCFQGGGTMRTPGGTVEVTPGSFVVHPRGGPLPSNHSKRMECKGSAGACHRALDPVAGGPGGKAPGRVQGSALAFTHQAALRSRAIESSTSASAGISSPGTATPGMISPDTGSDDGSRTM